MASGGARDQEPLTIRLASSTCSARGSKGDFDRTFSETATRILAEIDRLDAIARAFSRFGAPAAQRPPLEAVDLHAVAREVVQLYALGTEPAPGAPRFHVAGAAGAPALARRDEVKEVLVNLLEERGGRRGTVTVRVEAGGTRARGRRRWAGHPAGRAVAGVRTRFLHDVERSGTRPRDRASPGRELERRDRDHERRGAGHARVAPPPGGGRHRIGVAVARAPHRGGRLWRWRPARKLPNWVPMPSSSRG
jgi:hypothetical protein